MLPNLTGEGIKKSRGPGKKGQEQEWLWDLNLLIKLVSTHVNILYNFKHKES